MLSTMTDKRYTKIIHNKTVEYQEKEEECKCFHRARETILSVQLLAHKKQMSSFVVAGEKIQVANLVYSSLWLPFCILLTFGKFKITLNFSLKFKPLFN